MAGHDTLHETPKLKGSPLWSFWKNFGVLDLLTRHSRGTWNFDFFWRVKPSQRKGGYLLKVTKKCVFSFSHWYKFLIGENMSYFFIWRNARVHTVFNNESKSKWWYRVGKSFTLRFWEFLHCWSRPLFVLCACPNAHVHFPFYNTIVFSNEKVILFFCHLTVEGGGRL